MRKRSATAKAPESGSDRTTLVDLSELKATNDPNVTASEAERPANDERRPNGGRRIRYRIRRKSRRYW